MMMKGGNFTNKAQEALVSAQNIAQSKNQRQIDATHLLRALLLQEDSIVLNIMEKMGVDIDDLKRKTARAIEKMPSESIPRPPGQFYLTQDMAKVLDRARGEALKMSDDFISLEHMLLALLSIPSKAKEILDNATTLRPGKGGPTIAEEGKLDYDSILKSLAEIRGHQKITDPEPESKYQVIEKYTKNITTIARQGKLDPVIGRDDEIKRLTQIICRRTKNNPVLIGEAGVGKTAIVEGLAQKIIKGDIPESLRGKELVSLNIGSLVAGTKYRGEFEDRIKALLREIDKSKDKYILFIDELHTLVGAGGAEGAIDASNLLKPALARGELRAIGATTLKEYQKYIEKDSALERRFQPIYVAEPSIEDTILILRGIKEKYELHHGVKITDAALKKAVEFSARYVSDRYLPDKAVDLMDESMSYLRLEIESEPAELDALNKEIQKREIEKEALKNEESADAKKRLKIIAKELAELKEKSKSLGSKWGSEKEVISNIKRIKNEIDALKHEAEIAGQEADLQKVAEIKYGKIPELLKELKSYEKKLARIQKTRPMLREEVTEEDIAAVVAKWTGIPVTKLLETEMKKLERMEEIISKRVIGQDKAIKAIANAIRRARVGISEANRPLGSFLFLGPTGVGKTETARALAEFLFNDEKMLIRLDMSEYMERHSVSRMIGSPPGYVGHDEAGQLTEKIRRRPYSVVLFDEIEKAHPEVFNILLQVLEDGRLTDSKGRTASFKNAILIMTSNTGSQYISKTGPMGFSVENDEVKNKNKDLKEKVMESVKEEFRPEFLNRIDDIIIFNYLGKKEIRKIVDLEIQKIAVMLLKNTEIKINVTLPAKDFLGERGFDPTLGARPLRRLIQKMILDSLAMKIISGEIRAGEMATIDLHEKKIIVKTPRKIKDKKEAAIIK